jgi:hypothetical protein
VLCAVGFNIRHIDATEQKDVTPTGTAGQDQRGGCRVVVTCTTSGLRAVLETVGKECGCSMQLPATPADIKTVGVNVMTNRMTNIFTIEHVVFTYSSSFSISIYYPFYFNIYKSNCFVTLYSKIRSIIWSFLLHTYTCLFWR